MHTALRLPHYRTCHVHTYHRCHVSHRSQVTPHRGLLRLRSTAVTTTVLPRITCDYRVVYAVRLPACVGYHVPLLVHRSSGLRSSRLHLDHYTLPRICSSTVTTPAPPLPQFVYRLHSAAHLPHGGYAAHAFTTARSDLFALRCAARATFVALPHRYVATAPGCHTTRFTHYRVVHRTPAHHKVERDPGWEDTFNSTPGRYSGVHLDRVHHSSLPHSCVLYHLFTVHSYLLPGSTWNLMPHRTALPLHTHLPHAVHLRSGLPPRSVLDCVRILLRYLQFLRFTGFVPAAFTQLRSVPTVTGCYVYRTVTHTTADLRSGFRSFCCTRHGSAHLDTPHVRFDSPTWITLQFTTVLPVAVLVLPGFGYHTWLPATWLHLGLPQVPHRCLQIPTTWMPGSGSCLPHTGPGSLPTHLPPPTYLDSTFLGSTWVLWTTARPRMSLFCVTFWFDLHGYYVYVTGSATTCLRLRFYLIHTAHWLPILPPGRYYTRLVSPAVHGSTHLPAIHHLPF